MNNALRRRLGIIIISNSMFDYENMIDDVQSIFAKFIPLDLRLDSLNMYTSYTGYSSEFRVLEPSEKIPTYDAILHREIAEDNNSMGGDNLGQCHRAITVVMFKEVIDRSKEMSLLYDEKFLIKRFKEQEAYVDMVVRKWTGTDKFKVQLSSAVDQRNYFKGLLNQIGINI